MEILGVEYEVVRKTDTRKGYIRRKPDRSNPSPKQVENMLTFGKAAYNSYSEKEIVPLSPPAAVAVREAFVVKGNNEVQRVVEEEEISKLLDNINFSSAKEKIKFLQI